MPNTEIEEFGRIVVEHVRDEAIWCNDNRFSSKSVIAKRWKKELESKKGEELIKAILPDIVDNTIFYFIQAIDQGLLKLLFTASNGKTVQLDEDGLGELSGWYMGSEGWRFMFSKERLVDDFTDLNINPD